MKHFFLLLNLIFISNTIFPQKNFIDLPYLETSAKVDTLVTPDKIYLSIILSEKDTKDKISIEKLEKKMSEKLTELKINLPQQLKVTNLSSEFIKNFLKQPNVIKSKSYSLILSDAKIAMKVVTALEEENIANISIEKIEYSDMENLKLKLKAKAILKARDNAIAIVTPLNQKISNAIFIADLNTHNLDIQKNVMYLSTNAEYSKTEYEPLNIDFQKIKVEAEVNVKFRLE